VKSRSCHHPNAQSGPAALNGDSPDVGSPHRSAGRHQPASLMLQRVRTIVPKLTNDMQKGQCGRIGIFGGCIM
jgi:hypothetical protein